MTTATEDFTPATLKAELDAFAATFVPRKIEETKAHIREANMRGDTWIAVVFENAEPDEEVLAFFSSRGFRVSSPTGGDLTDGKGRCIGSYTAWSIGWGTEQ